MLSLLFKKKKKKNTIGMRFPQEISWIMVILSIKKKQ